MNWLTLSPCSLEIGADCSDIKASTHPCRNVIPFSQLRGREKRREAERGYLIKGHSEFVAKLSLGSYSCAKTHR